ncbi:glutathionylspermidine synthase like protein [Minicystis rosea]|nr:glutathionylspermidine synthase like protein [Minicystis rosea]
MSDGASSYDAFARRVVASGILTDPWLDGQPRFREAPLILTRGELGALYRVAEDVAAVYDELCVLVNASPALLDDFYGLTPWQKAMWTASAPLWHGIARADVFVTDAGIQIAEINCDTPTGEAEAVVLSALAAEARAGAVDPNRDLGDRFCQMVELLGLSLVDGPPPRAIGLVYPTELTEDLSVIRLYRRWLEERDLEVILGSPYNLRADAEGLRLFERPFSILLRHYKTDWWGERMSVWDDETIADADALVGPLGAALTSSIDRRAAVINPFGSVVPQNKRSMALMWEKLADFSPRAQETIRAHVPESRRLETMDPAQLVAERERWVIKSDYGAEGDEVILGRLATADEWREALAHAKPGRWIAQRYFSAREGEGGETINHGVYLIAGEASGIYARAQVGATDERALSLPVLIEG